MVVAHIGSGHILVLNAGDALTNLLALNARNITEHACFTEVLFGQVVSRQGSSVVSRKRDEMMENACLTRSICLERLDSTVSFDRQFSLIVVSRHQAIASIA